MTVSELYSYYTELTVHFTSLNRLFYEVMQHSSEFGDWYPPVLKKSIEILSEASSLQKMVVSEINKYEEELLKEREELLQNIEQQKKKDGF